MTGTQLMHKAKTKRHENILPETLQERVAGLNSENRRNDANAMLMRKLKVHRNQGECIKGISSVFITHSIEGFILFKHLFSNFFLYFSVENKDDYPKLDCLLGPSTSKGQYHNHLENNVPTNLIPNLQSITTNHHQPCMNTNYADQYQNPNTCPPPICYTSVPMNTPAPALTTTNNCHFPHLNENQSDRVSMHSLGTIDSKDLIYLDEQNVNIMSILDNLSTSLGKFQI